MPSFVGRRTAVVLSGVGFPGIWSPDFRQERSPFLHLRLLDVRRLPLLEIFVRDLAQSYVDSGVVERATECRNGEDGAVEVSLRAPLDDRLELPKKRFECIRADLEWGLPNAHAALRGECRVKPCGHTLSHEACLGQRGEQRSPMRGAGLVHAFDFEVRQEILSNFARRTEPIEELTMYAEFWEKFTETTADGFCRQRA